MVFSFGERVRTRWKTLELFQKALSNRIDGEIFTIKKIEADECCWSRLKAERLVSPDIK
jgi:hypothetical protein